MEHDPFGHQHGHAGHDHTDDPAPEKLDAAQRSLADALQVSFRLLSVLMLVVLGFLLLTGMTQIPPGKVGVRLLWGAIQGSGKDRVLGEGLHWSWPEPVGRVVKVETGMLQLDVNDFWMHETPDDALKPVRERQPPPEGLRPGFDGALLTGDRGLVHLKMAVYYSIKRQGGMERGTDTPASGPAPKPSGQVDPDAVIDFVANVRDPEEAVRSAVCNAAIQAAGKRTADGIYSGGQSDLVNEISDLAQRNLDKMRSGIGIQRVSIPDRTVPLAVRPAFDAVLSAGQDREKQRNQALGEADRILRSAAGVGWSKLVGDPKQPGDIGLLGRYAQAREKSDAREAESLLEQINTVLTAESEGDAAQIINAARSYSATIRQQVEGRANRFRQLRAAYEATPELWIQRQWAEIKKEIFTRPTNEKYYLTPGQKTVLKINQDPEVRKNILKKTLESKEDQGTARKPGDRIP